MSQIDPHIVVDQVRVWILNDGAFALDGTGCVVAETCRFTGRTGTATSRARALELLQQELRACVEFDEPLTSGNGDSLGIPFKMTSPHRQGIVHFTFDAEARAVTSIDIHYAQAVEPRLV